jgi:hypothetical protein
MGSQVFRSVPDMIRLFELLEPVCDYDEKWFVVSEMSFRKLLRNDLLSEYCQALKDNYHSSKHFYLAKHQSFNGFLTILRQLCKVMCIGYLSKIKYSHSNYSKVLEIYVPRQDWRDQILLPHEERLGPQATKYCA